MLRHRLAALISAAIVMIAAQLVAGSAWAHPGHSHDHAATATAQSPTVQPPHHGMRATTEQFQGFEAAGVSVVSVSAHGGDGVPVMPQSRGCTGGCCGNSVGCCGAVLASSSNSLPGFQAHKEIV